jgi:beta-mannosidase
VNDSPRGLDAVLEIAMFRDGRTPVAATKAAWRVPPHESVSRPVDALLGYFTDATNAYRFGPPKQDVILARLTEATTGEVLADAFHFPLGHGFARQPGAAVKASAQWLADGRVEVAIESDAFLQSVSVSCEGHAPADNYFHVAPGHPRRVLFTPAPANAGTFRASLEALNLPEAIVVRALPALAASGSDRPSPASGRDAA